MFAPEKKFNRIPVSTSSLLVPWLYILTTFYKTLMFQKKPLCSPQTKINYLESFLKFCSHCLYFRRYFTFFKTSIFHYEACYILRTTWKAKKALQIVYLVSRKRYPPSKSSFSFVKGIHSSKDGMLKNHNGENENLIFFQKKY